MQIKPNKKNKYSLLSQYKSCFNLPKSLIKALTLSTKIASIISLLSFTHSAKAELDEAKLNKTTITSTTLENKNPANKNTNFTIKLEQLKQLLTLSEQEDLNLQAAKQEMLANSEKSIQALASFLPTVNLQGNTSYNNQLPKQGNHFVGATHSLGLTVNQTLFKIDKFINLKQGDLVKQLAQLQYSASLQQTLDKTLDAYFDVLQAQLQINNLQSSQKTTAEQYKFAKRNFDVGIATITDVQEAQAKLDQIAAKLLQANNDKQVKLSILELLTGRLSIDLNIPSIDEQWLNTMRQFKIQAATQFTAANHIQAKIAKINSDIAQKDYEKAKVLHYPTLDLVASSGINKTPQPFSSNKNMAIGLQFNLPLFVGVAQDSKKNETAALYQKAKLQNQSILKQLQTSYDTTLKQLDSLLAQQSAYQSAINSSVASLKSTQKAYTVGVRVNLDVLSAQEQLNAVQLQAWQNQLLLLKTTLKLKLLLQTQSVDSLSRLD